MLVPDATRRCWACYFLLGVLVTVGVSIYTIKVYWTVKYKALEVLWIDVVELTGGVVVLAQLILQGRLHLEF